MTTFLDGPAIGKTLMLRRTPIFLRVTEEGGSFDALNSPGDTARPTEKLFAYVMVRHHGSVHLNIAGGKGGVFQRCDYKLIELQPADAEMRDQWTWGEWVENNKHKAPSSFE